MTSVNSQSLPLSVCLSVRLSVRISFSLSLCHTHTHTRVSEVSQSCPTLHDPMDCSPPGSSVHEIFQARVLEWVDISFSRGSSDPGIKPRAPSLRADALPSETPGKLHYYLTDFSLFLPSFVLLRSLITETCSREVIASRFRPRNGLGQNPSL